jgi:hypothetical protein
MMGLLVALGLGVATAYLAAGSLLDRATRRVVAALAERRGPEDVAVREFDFEGVDLSSPRSATWRGVRALVERQQRGRPTGERYEITIERVTVRVSGPGSLDLEAQELRVVPSKNTNGPRAASFEGSYVRLPVDVKLLDPLPDLRAAARELLALGRSGTMPEALEVDGRARIRLRGSEIVVRIGVVETESGRELVANRQDLAQISRLFHEGLTEAEIDLISRNALRAPRALAITERAQTTAKRAAHADSRVPEDTYRHVFWSYLLAREFGDEFARALTDAHEQRDARRPPLDRELDLRNNAVGRDYARRGIPEHQILAHLLDDARVARVR